MAAVLVARQGRELQRYSQRTGGRIVVGCIPYRVRCDGELEVLVITSQKGHGMMFPKGGWEEDESMDEAARREALEEAGVLGDTEPVLGFWHYKSRRYVDQTYEGFMFPLRVADELHQWPEMASRKRTWVSSRRHHFTNSFARGTRCPMQFHPQNQCQDMSSDPSIVWNNRQR
ncbi:hypothetical protein PVAP13_1KG500500 [Panicum virgatum]|uniref:Nudix hydrolase domain-containing protein n=1 Tax=Panicum virgatum TaxID=38727 RepID=A0A8T0XT03_PANVG|nr:hypothetical protein PVAP13_1KG500500 [Panicum virgatum]